MARLGLSTFAVAATLLASSLQFLEVSRRGRAGVGGSRPGVLQDVSSLEILLIAGLLEGQVLRKGRGAVAQVQAGENDLRRTTGRRRGWRWPGSPAGSDPPESGADARSGSRIIEPEDTEGAQLLR